MADNPAPEQTAQKPAPEPTAQQVAETMASRRFIGLLIVVSVIGVVVSLAAWCFLELIYQLQQELYTHLPHALGYSSAPVWWPLPVLAVAGVLVALAITRLPGDGGHLPANGLAAGGTPHPEYLPSVLLAGIATIGFGMVLGPEAPLIALGSGLALLLMRLIRRPMEPPVLAVIAGAGAFAAVSFIFGSPMIAAVLIIELIAIGGPRLTLVMVPGLLCAGIGSLVSLGLGSFTGLSSKNFALVPLSVPHFSHLTFVDFIWTILFAIVVAVVTRGIMLGGLRTHRVISQRLMLALPAIGLIVAGLAILFAQVSGKSVNEVLFSGQDALPGIVSQASTWSIGALLLVIGCKGIAYSLALGSYRGGPTFPAIYLGAAAGILASHLPGFDFAPAVAVGIGASMVSVLRLPLSSVVVATVITFRAGTGEEPLIIVGVVTAYLMTLLLSEVIAPRRASEAATVPAQAVGAVGAGSPP
jgi:chloride channel protein, CIC family